MPRQILIYIYADLIGEAVKRYSVDISLSGIPRKIAYWEIWNEPDLPFFWNTDDVKIGDAGAAFGLNFGCAFLDGLLAYCRTKNVSIDFLSWHFTRARQPIREIFWTLLTASRPRLTLKVSATWRLSA